MAARFHGPGMKACDAGASGEPVASVFGVQEIHDGAIRQTVASVEIRERFSVEDGNALGCAEPEEAVRITLDAASQSVRLLVCDSGHELQADLAADIGKRPLASETGLGIGLYQLDRTARLYGYRLELAVNRPGKVCFGLTPEA